MDEIDENIQHDYPDEVQCFICMKLVDAYYTITLRVHTSDSTVLANVAVCEEDYHWTKNNKDAASAVVQSRFNARIKRDQDEMY